MKKLAIFIFFLCVSISSEAQTLKAFIAAAENSFLSKDYYSALIYYNNALEFDTSNLDLQFRSAEASRLFNAYTPAERKYQHVLDNDSEDRYPMSSFWLADIKQKKGKYSEAKALYEIFLSENEESKYYNSKALKEIKACEWALSVIENPDESAEIIHLGDGINSPYSEFGAIYDGEKEALFFSSLRYEKLDDVYNPKRLISKVLKSEDQTTGSLIEGQLNDNEKHIAHTAWNTNKTGVYYTECEYVNNNEIRCNIYYRGVDENGEFLPSVKLPESINQEGTTSTQPNVGFDSVLEEEVLFFVSDRKGGKGNLDMWSVSIKGKNQFGEVRNLGELNTYENDITPFFHNPTQSLFFSSEGYQSLGGYDVFKAIKERSSFLDAEHQPAPINSSYHDVYYTIDDKMEKGHLSSNREGSYFLEAINEACCYDIYEINYEEVNLDLNALTYDKDLLSNLEGVEVQLIEKRTGKIVSFYLNENDNTHPFKLDRNIEYTLIATKEGYTSDTLDFTTQNIFESQTLTKKLFLKSQSVELNVLTFDGLTNSRLIGTTVRLVDPATGEIIGEEQYNPSGNSFSWKVIPGKTYKIIASRNGYETASSTITIKAGNPQITKKIFLGRGAESYLPIALYFDNDIPDLRSVKTYTDKSYTNTYQPYVVKQEEFKSKYSKPLNGEAKISASQKVNDFFEFDVKGGYGQMQAFLSQLTKELESGRSITLTIKGYASPRAASAYNRALSKRRTHSFKNELVRYANGALSKYFVNNQLDVLELPFGEDTASTDISDKISDRRNSIYSVEASKERRIEIVGLKYQ